MKIVSIVGARPQFIKLGPLSKILRQNFTEIVIHTGQHYDNEMSELLFQELELPRPDYYLGINGGGHGEQTGKMLIELEKILILEKPDLVIVFGDTNSTLAGSLAASKLSVKSVHVEAGLRSFNRTMPEEINRIVSDQTSDFLFAPTKTAISNLSREGLKEKSFLTGDIMVDTLYTGLQKLEDNSRLEKLNLLSNNYYLLTLHRPYNVDNPNNLRIIISKLSELDSEIIFPVHPRTKKIIHDNKIDFSERFKIIKPLGYLDFLAAQNSSKKIITDSGGVQKEAYLLKKPCITLRPETEWVETVEEGWNLLIDINSADAIKNILGFNPSKKQSNVFGKNVAKKMSNVITNLLN